MNSRRRCWSPPSLGSLRIRSRNCRSHADHFSWSVRAFSSGVYLPEPAWTQGMGRRGGEVGTFSFRKKLHRKVPPVAVLGMTSRGRGYETALDLERVLRCSRVTAPRVTHLQPLWPRRPVCTLHLPLQLADPCAVAVQERRVLVRCREESLESLRARSVLMVALGLSGGRTRKDGRKRREGVEEGRLREYREL